MNYNLETLAEIVANDRRDFSAIIVELEAVEDKTQLVDHVCEVLVIIEELEFSLTVEELLDKISN
jgi:hypothetical protein